MVLESRVIKIRFWMANFCSSLSFAKVWLRSLLLFRSQLKCVCLSNELLKILFDSSERWFLYQNLGFFFLVAKRFLDYPKYFMFCSIYLKLLGSCSIRFLHFEKKWIFLILFIYRPRISKLFSSSLNASGAKLPMCQWHWLKENKLFS